MPGNELIYTTNKLLIIGGTGGTGKELIRQALERSCTVTALVRDPARVKISHPALTVIKGDVLDPKSLQDAVKGKDAVLSALGHKRFFIPSTILSEGTRNIIGAMEKSGVKRLICITSLGIGDSRFRLGLYYTLFVIPVIIFFYFMDKSRQEALIKNSTLDWTIIRPGQLTNGKMKKQYKHGSGLGHYILTKMISRADVAHFMLEQLNNPQYVGKTPGITY